MPATACVTSGDDLLDYVNYEPARDYIRLLMVCAQDGVTVGLLESTVEAEAVSDWEACMLIDRDLTVAEITDIRETLCRKSDLIVRHGHRKGQPTYRFHDELQPQ